MTPVSRAHGPVLCLEVDKEGGIRTWIEPHGVTTKWAPWLVVRRATSNDYEQLGYKESEWGPRRFIIELFDLKTGAVVFLSLLPAGPFRFEMSLRSLREYVLTQQKRFA